MGWGCIAQWGGWPPLFANFATTLFPGSLMVLYQEASGPTFLAWAGLHIVKAKFAHAFLIGCQDRIFANVMKQLEIRPP
jgi:hypothetical protein